MIAIVHWEDSRQPTSAWQFESEWKSQGAVQCYSVGWVIEDSDGLLGLAGSHAADGDDRQINGVIQIPKRCIVERMEISDPYRTRETEDVAD